MVGKQVGVALVVAARAGVAAAQEADEPVLIPPAPAAVEQGSEGDDADGGPILVPAVPASPSREDDGPALREPPASAGGSEGRAESGEVRIRRRGTERRAEAPPVVGSDAAPAVERREERAAEVAEDVRSRYRLVGGEWWFQTRSGRWKYYRGGEWRDFDPVTFVPLRALPERAGAGAVPYAALRPVSPAGGEDEEAGDVPRVPPGYRLVPADRVDVRTGTYYGPGPEGYGEPVPEEARERRRPVRSMIWGFLGR